METACGLHNFRTTQRAIDLDLKAHLELQDLAA